jgi:pimeloyl-ACP methyl ester carboxylesterase
MIDTGRIRLGVDRRGDGPPVILVGGTGMPPIAWEVSGLSSALADSGFEVIAYSAPGVAPSDAPSPDCTIADLGEDLTSLIETLSRDRPPALVGYSPGSFTIEHPLSTCPSKFSAGDPLVEQWATMTAFQSDQWTSNDGEVARARASHAWLRDEECMDRLERIVAPVLAVAFEFDPLLGPTRAQSAVDQIPGGELCVIADAGHGGVMTHAQHVVPRVVEFLIMYHC